MNAEEYVVNRVVDLENMNARYKAQISGLDKKLDELRKVIFPLLKHSETYGYYMEAVYDKYQPVTISAILGCLSIDRSEIKEADS